MKKGSIHSITVAGCGLMLLLAYSGNAFTFTAPNRTEPVRPGPNGAALYGSNCSICHGRNGSGTPAWKAKGQPDLSSADWQKSRSDEQIAERIRVGKGKMPAFAKKFSDEDVMALVRHVRSFRK
jgi:mono/diheme cytochrome c family protein